ncbi:DUF2358 domain-containing protein [Anthocerotibacter panamensis]|uniref:DUF2358 domain-containing protein n=1 Tax=Anthocerotibacter panamensis TaxID=2857077 RepID=UPI001C401E68|nr:DUF2358 domain-containing protein [Anthocerotibacter panamensis]
MDILEIIRSDYQRFPQDQTYAIYAPDVYFEDPLNCFRGREQFQRMVGLLGFWFKNLRLDLHAIQRAGDCIETRWTMSWLAPLPWQPPIAVSGKSELLLNPDGLIVSHIDYWDISRLDLLKQHIPGAKAGTP